VCKQNFKILKKLVLKVTLFTIDGPFVIRTEYIPLKRTLIYCFVCGLQTTVFDHCTLAEYIFNFIPFNKLL